MTDVHSERPSPLLDVRSASDFEASHRAGSVNISLEDLPARLHELPHPGTPLAVFDVATARAEAAADFLRTGGREEVRVFSGVDWLKTGPGATGPGRDRLWRPHGLLVEAVTWAREAWPSFEGRRALDIACGSGRDAVYLAESGLSVDACDILPDALDRCRDLAMRNSVTVHAAVHDVERNPTIQQAAYDLICVFNYLHRPLMSVIADAVRPGGLVVYETFCEPQRERYGKPRRPQMELKTGELSSFFPEWQLIVFREGPASPRRIAASLIARKADDRTQ